MIKIKHLVTLVGLVSISSVSLSECYKVDNLIGYNTSNEQPYKYKEWGFSNKSYEINFDKESPASPDSGRECELKKENVLVCEKTSKSYSLIETWVAYPKEKLVYKTETALLFNKAMASVLTGTIIGKCDQK